MSIAIDYLWAVALYAGVLAAVGGLSYGCGYWRGHDIGIGTGLQIGRPVRRCQVPCCGQEIVDP